MSGACTLKGRTIVKTFLRLVLAVSIVVLAAVAFLSDGSSAQRGGGAAAQEQDSGELPPELLKLIRTDTKLEVGGIYLAPGSGHVAASSAAHLRRGIKRVGAVHVMSLNEDLAHREGLRIIVGREKVKVLDLENDGALVKVLALDSEEELWTVAPAIAAAYVSRDHEPVLIGRGYEVAVDALGASTVDGVYEAYDQAHASIPEPEEYRFDEEGVVASERAQREAYETIGTRSGFRFVERGERVSVVDFDVDDIFAVKVKPEAGGMEYWILTRSLASKASRLPTAER